MMDETIRNTLPSFQFRRSFRAKRLQLKVELSGRVEIILPRGTSEATGRAFFDDNLAWVHKQLARHALYDSHTEAAWSAELYFRCIDQIFKIRYQPDNRVDKALSVMPNELCISGEIIDVTAWKKIIKPWLICFVRPYLTDLLNAISQKIAISYQQVSFRLLKSRWGSCGPSGHVNLNAKLLFLPKSLVEYVMIHELCHIIHCNHSPQFWRLVETFMPDYRQAVASLRRADQWLPRELL